MDKKVKVAVIVLIIVIIIVAAVITAYYVMDTQNKENNITNNIIENALDNEEENILNQTEDLNQTVQTQNSTPNTLPDDNIVSGSEEDLVEKAIEIVKEDWGEDNAVYFDYAGIDNEGRYVISVNDKETTQVLQWYSVNTTTEQFFKQ